MRKKDNYKKINLILIILSSLFILTLIIKGIVSSVNKTNNGLDFKFGIINKDGLELVSISNERKMTNDLIVNGEVKVWSVNEGKWVESRELWNMSKNDDKVLKDFFWYNFGFNADKILIFEEKEQWKNDFNLVKIIGVKNWIKYRLNSDQMLFKKENLDKSLKEKESSLDEIMSRDFADSKLVNEETRLSVFNTTSEEGLANFISKRLEWSGFLVIGSSTSEEKIDKCLILYGDGVDISFGWQVINKIFDCEKKYDGGLNKDEMELYFGDNFATMIKYPEYLN
jgi:hypothetical protein